MNFKERIQKFASYYGLTVAQLQEKLGLSNAYFSNVTKVSPKVQLKIQDMYPNINIDWINFGKGTMLNSDGNVMPISNVQVPLVPTFAMAGRLTEFNESCGKFDCERILSPVRDADLAITISGDSMAPEYSNGCIVFVARINEPTYIEWGKTYVLETINGVIIKNIYPSKEDSYITCRSINPTYHDFDIAKKDIFGWYRVLLEMTKK